MGNCLTLGVGNYLTFDNVRRRRLSAPWYRQKRQPSFADMLVALRREIISAQYTQGLPREGRSADRGIHSTGVD